MKKGEIYIDLNLQDPNCTMLCPGYIYLEDKDGFRTRDKKERDPDNLIKLEQMISTCMQKRHQKELMETLEKKTLSLYIDCRNK
jgi:hypothetical protein